MLRDVHPGSDLDFFRLPDPESGSATMKETTQNVQSLKFSVTQRTIVGQMLPIILTLIGDLFKL
jgi:hypothetical protein